MKFVISVTVTEACFFVLNEMSLRTMITAAISVSFQRSHRPKQRVAPCLKFRGVSSHTLRFFRKVINEVKKKVSPSLHAPKPNFRQQVGRVSNDIDTGGGSKIASPEDVPGNVERFSTCFVGMAMNFDDASLRRDVKRRTHIILCGMRNDRKVFHRLGSVRGQTSRGADICFLIIFLRSLDTYHRSGRLSGYIYIHANFWKMTPGTTRAE